MLPVNSRALIALVAAAAFLTACERTIVEVVEVANLVLDPPAAAVQLGDNVQLNADATSARGEPLTRDVSFSSSDTDVADVSASGVVTSRGAGVATITATSGGASATATVHVVDLPCESNGSLLPGDSDPGDLNSDCVFTAGVDAAGRDLAGRFVDLWLLVIESAGTVNIDMTSGDFDTYLFVVDQQFNVLGENDDVSQGNLNSRITVNLPPGAYIIEATTFAVGAEGSYELSVSS